MYLLAAGQSPPVAGRFDLHLDPAKNRGYPAGDSRWGYIFEGSGGKQLQAELRDMKLSTSSVPVSSAPSRLCWTCNSLQHFQRNCPSFTGQSFGTPGWNDPFRQTGPPRHPGDMQDTHLNN